MVLEILSNIDDKEVNVAAEELLQRASFHIFIAEDMTDAIRDGMNAEKNFHKTLTDGRVVWLALEHNN